MPNSYSVKPLLNLECETEHMLLVSLGPHTTNKRDTTAQAIRAIMQLHTKVIPYITSNRKSTLAEVRSIPHSNEL